MDASICGMEMQTQEKNEAGQGEKIDKRSKGKHPTQGRKVGRRLLRQRINAKLKALQELIPNCSERGQASILDDAIKYINNLQLRLQMMMSMRAWSTFQQPQATMMPQPVQPFLQIPTEGISEMKYEIGALEPPAAIMPQPVQHEIQIHNPTPFQQTPAGITCEMTYETGALMMPQPVQPGMQSPSLAPFLQTSSEDIGEMKYEIGTGRPDIFPSSYFPMGLPNSPFSPPPHICRQQCSQMMRVRSTASVLPTQIVLPHGPSPSGSSEW